MSKMFKYDWLTKRKIESVTTSDENNKTKYIYMQDEKVIDEDVAKEAMLKFLIEEIGPFVEYGFKEEREKLNKKIDDEINGLKKIISNRLDDAVTDVVRTLKDRDMLQNVTDKVETELINIVKSKLKSTLDEDDNKN